MILQKGLGFKFNPIQGSGWQSNKDLFETDTEFSELRKSLIVKVNDILTARLNEISLQAGFVALQKWGDGEVRFRNLKIY